MHCVHKSCQSLTGTLSVQTPSALPGSLDEHICQLSVRSGQQLLSLKGGTVHSVLHVAHAACSAWPPCPQVLVEF